VLSSCCEHALHDGRADAKGPTDLEHAHTLGPEGAYALLDGRLDWTPAELDAVFLGPRKPGVDPLNNHGALKLSEHAAHLEHGAA
jgi:hypothetical protein